MFYQCHTQIWTKCRLSLEFLTSVDRDAGEGVRATYIPVTKFDKVVSNVSRQWIEQCVEGGWGRVYGTFSITKLQYHLLQDTPM